MLCGRICGWQYGAAVGGLLPIMRSLILGMPPIYPTAAAMAVELCVYGLSVGAIYGQYKKQNILSVYVSMISAMLLGRGAWGIAQIFLLGLKDLAFTWQAFIAGAFLNAIPGIVLQLALIPSIMTALHMTGLHCYRFSQAEKAPELEQA